MTAILLACLLVVVRADVTQYDCDMAWATYYQEIVSHHLSPRLTQTFSLTMMRGVYMTECGCGMFGE